MRSLGISGTGGDAFERLAVFGNPLFEKFGRHSRTLSCETSRWLPGLLEFAGRVGCGTEGDQFRKHQTRDSRQRVEVTGSEAKGRPTPYRRWNTVVNLISNYNVLESFPFAGSCDGGAPFLNPPGERAAASLES